MLDLVDSHCHLDDPRFAADREAVLVRAHQAGVRQIIVPATSAARWPQVRAACQDQPGIYPAYGLHPMFIDQHQPGQLAALEQELAVGDAVAIGECGLDFSSPAWDPVQQQYFFAAQISLARQTGLPLIIHARKAVEQVILALKCAGGVAAVVHSYSGSIEQARQLADLGVHVSIGGPMTHARANRLHKLVAALPDWQLLLETDAPDQPDACCQGQRNEPARLAAICDFAASLRQTTPQALAELTSANARRLFGLPALV
jgi:TatD DNase family protein